jgi:uncharacterized protein (TIGR02217 family)
MEYLRAYIEACETFGFSGGPEFDTRVVTLANGRERRNANWPQYRNRYTLPFQNINATNYRDIREMFEVCRGQLGVFRYSDPLARFADNQTFAIADGRESYQLTTIAVRAGVDYRREVYAIPEGEEPVLTANGVTIPNSHYDVDIDRGLIYPVSSFTPGDVLRWTGPFDVWVRFASDWLPWSIDSRNQDTFLHNGSVDLIEMPPPALEGSS